jgi:hypothetical protein
MQEIDPGLLTGPNARANIRNYVDDLKRRYSPHTDIQPCTKQYTHFVANFSLLPKYAAVSLSGEVECVR